MNTSTSVLACRHPASVPLVTLTRYCKLLAGSLLCLLIGTVAFAKVNLGKGPDRRLLQVGDLLGTENPISFEETTSGGLILEFETKRVVYSAEGDHPVEVYPEQAYAAATDLLVDFSVKGQVSVRRGLTGELLAEHLFPENDARVLNAFFTDEGRICHAKVSYKKLVSFDPLTGEVMRVEESFSNWQPVGRGPIMESHTFMASLPEWPTPPSWPVRVRLYDSRTGERLFEEDGLETGWLYRGPLSGQQAYYLTDRIRVIDTLDASYQSLSLDGGYVYSRMLAPSQGGDQVAALVWYLGDENEVNYRLGVWDMLSEQVVWIRWDDTWGDTEDLLDLSVTTSGDFLVLSMRDSGILRVNTATADAEPFFEWDTGSWNSVAVLEEDSLLLTVDMSGKLRFFEWDTGSEVFASTIMKRIPSLGQTDLKEWKLSAAGEVMFLGTDSRVRRLDLMSKELFVVAPKNSLKVSAVWPGNEQGLALVLFADGSVQYFDTETGEVAGSRRQVISEPFSVLENDVDERFLVLNDGRIFDMNTEVLIFDLSVEGERSDLSGWERQSIMRLSGSESLRAKLLKSGNLVAFFDGEWAAIFDLATHTLLDARERAWQELVESDSFFVAWEEVSQGDGFRSRRLAVYDAETFAESYRVAVPNGVKVSVDGRHFAWVEEGSVKSHVEADAYDKQFVLRQFALEEMGFSEIPSVVWTKSFLPGEFPSHGTPSLLRYEGPDEQALVLVGLERILELPSGLLTEWDRPPYRNGRGTEFLQQTENGRILLLDELGRLGLYGYFVPRVRSVDLRIVADGRVEPELSGLSPDRIDVWRSSDLLDWQRWSGLSVELIEGRPVFFRLIEWVPE